MFWELPGPAAFVDAAVEDLRQGCSVVFCLPDCHPSGLHQAFRSALATADGWMWDRIDCSNRPDRPIDILFERYAPNSLPKAARTVWALDQQSSIWGLLLWLDDLTEATWPQWRQFLVDYAVVARQRSRFERCAFCVPLTGVMALSPPTDDVSISVRRWSGSVDSLDMTMYTSRLLRGDRLSPVQRRLAISLITGTALWDPSTSERLANEPLDVLMDPRPVLVDIAHERGWESGANPTAGWHRGMSDCFEGRVQPHSAMLAIADGTNELNSRIWKAEVSVVLPHLEEQRREVLSRYGRMFRLPFVTRFGEVITDPFDLELPHIASQLGRLAGRVDFRTRRAAERMAAVRNKLAHLDPLELGDLDVLT